MPNGIAPSLQSNIPGSWNDASIDDDYLFDESGMGSYSGPETVQEGVLTPTFNPGEIWSLKITLTLSSENTDDILVLALMDEGENYYIARNALDSYSGNYVELNCLVDYDAASNGGSSSSPSPDIRVEVIGSDGGNYFIDVEAVRVRREVNTSNRLYPFSNTESID